MQEYGRNYTHRSSHVEYCNIGQISCCLSLLERCVVRSGMEYIGCSLIVTRVRVEEPLRTLRSDGGHKESLLPLWWPLIRANSTESLLLMIVVKFGWPKTVES